MYYHRVWITVAITDELTENNHKFGRFFCKTSGSVLDEWALHCHSVTCTLCCTFFSLLSVIVALTCLMVVKKLSVSESPRSHACLLFPYKAS